MTDGHTAEEGIHRVTAIVGGCSPAAVAVSGGVDSMTLGMLAHRAAGDATAMFHAVSPAVPRSATERVLRYAAAHGWDLRVIDAGEFADERYMRNPANRCFFCKSNLYGVIAAEADGYQLLSGTNLDDLGDWRPGLRAAAQHSVRHPFVEAGLTKAAVRAVARHCGMQDVAELPAAPCLSSRVETGIRIDPSALAFIERAEEAVRRVVDAETVRCRVRRAGVRVELDQGSYDRMTDGQRSTILGVLDEMRRADGAVMTLGEIAVVPYVRGSAFLRGSA